MPVPERTLPESRAHEAAASARPSRTLRTIGAVLAAAALFFAGALPADAALSKVVTPTWAGLVGKKPPGGKYDEIFGVWTVPSVKCSKTHAAAAEWVGLDGSDNATVEQAGTETDCDNGKPNYFAWYSFYNGKCCLTPIPAKTLSIAPGDVVAGRVERLPKGLIRLTLQVQTPSVQFYGWSVEMKPGYTAAASSAECIVEAPIAKGGSLLPLANFGRVHLQDCDALDAAGYEHYFGTGERLLTTSGTGSLQQDPLNIEAVSMLDLQRKPRAKTELPDSSGADAGKPGSFGVVWQAAT